MAYAVALPVEAASDSVCDAVSFAGVGWDPAVSGSIIAFENEYRIYYHDAATGVTHDPGIVGEAPEISGSIIVFETREALVGDLNGDGDSNDRILRYYDISTGVVTNTAIEGVSAWISGSVIAFIWRDGSYAKPGWYDIGTEAVTHLDVIIDHYYRVAGVSVSGSKLVYSRKENYQHDFNGDGDMTDDVVHFYDIETQVEVNTGIRGDGPVVSGSIIVFAVYEETDLNEDGDASDHLVRYYDTESGQVANAPLDEGWDPEISGNIIVYYAFEWQSNEDLNGDGVIDGAIITVYYDISTDTLTSTRIDSWYVGIGGSLIAMMGSERQPSENCDWNGDGNIGGRAIVYLPIETSIGLPDLAARLLGYLADGSIGNRGIAEALQAFLDQAQADIDRGNTVAATNKLDAFISLVLAQSGKHISEGAAADLSSAAQTVIEGF